MQIPTEWYVHIVPGALILVGVLFLLGTKTRKGLSDLMARQAIGSTVAIVVCAYIIGFVENAIILFGIRPLLNHITSVDPPTAHSIAEWTTFHRTELYPKNWTGCLGGKNG
jgi:predicted membrane protein